MVAIQQRSSLSRRVVVVVNASLLMVPLRNEAVNIKQMRKNAEMKRLRLSMCVVWKSRGKLHAEFRADWKELRFHLRDSARTDERAQPSSSREWHENIEKPGEIRRPS